ncbi:hypothetical protein [Acuticoccus sediminis]|uniref:hypothetical protein n=1 Tax=Acuticoccus sediminis TaxID=2184697 RepID=UPI001CFEF675|nr:hypothetical protein [Acuticoccus sediminis]
MDDLVPHVDWSAEFFQSDFNDLNSSINAGTEAAGRTQDDVEFGTLGHHGVTPDLIGVHERHTGAKRDEVKERKRDGVGSA